MAGVDHRGLDIPFTRMGRVSSENLFDPNEQVIFDFYEANRGRYRRALDVGANLGVHSILMARCGWQVRAFEPDPRHFARLERNLAAHGAEAVEAEQAAVSDCCGSAAFVRVLQNETASHLAGARDFEGPVQRFSVKVVDCRPLFSWADFAKIDCEGHEAALVRATIAETWMYLDAMIEVGSPASATAIYEHLRPLVPMWSQKREWCRVRSVEDMPAHHSEGSLFVGVYPPWREA